MQPEPIIYDDDTRYPGPDVHPPPEYITGIPTQRELDAQARMFTWGELKGIVRESWFSCSRVFFVPSGDCSKRQILVEEERGRR
jgi:hypothetical protein